MSSTCEFSSLVCSGHLGQFLVLFNIWDIIWFSPIVMPLSSPSSVSQEVYAAIKCSISPEMTLLVFMLRSWNFRYSHTSPFKHGWFLSFLNEDLHSAKQKYGLHLDWTWKEEEYWQYYISHHASVNMLIISWYHRQGKRKATTGWKYASVYGSCYNKYSLDCRRKKYYSESEFLYVGILFNDNISQTSIYLRPFVHIFALSANLWRSLQHFFYFISQ